MAEFANDLEARAAERWGLSADQWLELDPADRAQRVADEAGADSVAPDAPEPADASPPSSLPEVGSDAPVAAEPSPEFPEDDPVEDLVIVQPVPVPGPPSIPVPSPSDLDAAALTMERMLKQTQGLQAAAHALQAVSTAQRMVDERLAMLGDLNERIAEARRRSEQAAAVVRQASEQARAVVQDALEQAKVTREDAEREATEIRETARRTVSEARDQARIERDEIVGRAIRERDSARSEVAGLGQQADAARQRLAAAQDELAAVEGRIAAAKAKMAEMLGG